MKFSFWLALVALGVFTRVSLAQGQESNSSCSKLSTAKEIVACAEINAPDAAVNAIDAERAEAEVNALGQWRNPEFSINSVQGSAGGQARGETDLTLSFPIEIGKVSSRKALGQAQADKAKAMLAFGRAEIQSEIILKMHRLRQVHHEIEVVDEAISTFSKLLEQFAKRPGLSPEQKVSSIVYRMAKSEYQIKKTETKRELAQIDAYFRTVVGKSATEIKTIRLPEIHPLPELNVSVGGARSAKTLLLQAEVDESQALLSSAQAESWPTLSLGPSMKIQKEGDQSNSLIGFNLGMPIPFFNVNGAGRAAAAKSLMSSQRKSANYQTQERLQRERWVAEYDQAKQTLREILSHSEIELRHREVEVNFLKGLVSSALVIEAHRTYVDLEKSRNELELKAIEAIHQISIIDGKAVEFGL